MRGPTFQCEAIGDGLLRLHYFSHRQGLFPIVKGLVRQVSRLLFEMDVKLVVLERSQERRKSGMVEHVVFSLEPDEEHRAGKRLAYKFKRDTRLYGDVEVADPHAPLAVNLKDFSTIFPYHICFNKQMVVEHVGRHLLVEYGLADKKMLKLSELVQLIQPADIQQLTHKTIMSYLNTLFIFQLKHHCKRNEVEKGSSEAFQQPLCLKGQMLPTCDGNYIIFLCSPYVTTVRDFVDLKLYLSDMPMYDATRDLVMLNQSRICQMELNKKLEETVRQLKALAEDLERKKQRTEHLLYEFVPAAIAESFRLGKPVPPQEYSECTVMFTDVPDFPTINGSCHPAQCTKVLSLLDSYLVVSGAPNVNKSHVENMLNLALGTIFAGRCVIVPELNLPVRVRVGISCGSVVAGVVSHEKPRTVSRQQGSQFVFRQHQPIECGPLKMLTHFLEKNEKLSIWEIAGVEKEATQSIDGYKELNSTESDDPWEKMRTNVARKLQVIDAFRPGPSRSRRALLRLQAVKRKFRAAQSNDSGVSMSEPNLESAVCSVM
nr:Haem NO binding and Haem NO binding associated and Adenylyl cyclase class-3 4 guanylyl cyclase domain containing protein [Haemonchus contortus]